MKYDKNIKFKEPTSTKWKQYFTETPIYRYKNRKQQYYICAKYDKIIILEDVNGFRKLRATPQNYKDFHPIK